MATRLASHGKTTMALRKSHRISRVKREQAKDALCSEKEYTCLSFPVSRQDDLMIISSNVRS